MNDHFSVFKSQSNTIIDIAVFLFYPTRTQTVKTIPVVSLDNCIKRAHFDGNNVIVEIVFVAGVSRQFTVFKKAVSVRQTRRAHPARAPTNDRGPAILCPKR